MEKPVGVFPFGARFGDLNGIRSRIISSPELFKNSLFFLTKSLRFGISGN